MNEREYISYLLNEAKRLSAIGQVGIAREKYEEVLKYDPDNEEARRKIKIYE
ncbi:hypothetical protein MASR1M45_04990 [Candidatus Kapaibacterium sp.]